MSSLIEGIKAKKFAVLGRAGMDLFAAPIGVKSEDAEQFQADLGGSAANIAVGLCKLGCEASLITALSNDAVGRFCLNRLRFYNVATRYITLINGEFRSSLAVYESCIDDFQNVLYRNGAADFQVTKQDIDNIDFSQFSALITTGTVFASEPSRSASFYALEKAKKQNIPIIFDIDYRPYSWNSAEEAAEILARAGELSDMIVGNDEEFGFMAGQFDKGLEKAKSLARTHNRAIIYKMGSKGAISFIENIEISTGIFEVKPIKPNGAGDSFLSSLLASIADGYGWEEAILRGSASAAIVVAKAGCAPAMPDKKELDQFIAQHPL